MKIPFRQGIVSCYKVGSTPQFLRASSTPGYVDLNVSPEPTVVAFAHGPSDYLEVFDQDVLGAWGPITPGIDSYLYWDIDLITAQVRFKITELQPISSLTAPVAPLFDQHWFDLSTTTMRYWSGTKWIPKVAVMAGKVLNGSVATVQPFTDGVSQVGITDSCSPGYIMQNSQLRPIYANPGTWEFLTTATPVHILTTSGTSGVLAVAPNAFIPVRASQNISRFSLVYLSGADSVALASGNPALVPPRFPIGIVEEDLSTNEIGTLTQSGEVQWDQFALPPYNFGSYIGWPIYCGDNGEITTVRPNGLQAWRIGFIKNSTTILIHIDSETQPQVYQASASDVIVNGAFPISTSYVNSSLGERIWTVAIAPSSTIANGYMSSAQVIQLDGYGTRLTQAESDILGRALLIHSHTIASVTGLQGALDAKSDVGHNHDSLYSQLGHNHDLLYSQLGHIHTIVDVSGLQTALNGKESTIAPGLASDYYSGNKTWLPLDSTAVGLGNVNNTSDINKPISTATQTALNGKVAKAGDTMTGALVLSGAPTLALHAATKQYVDDNAFVIGSINQHTDVDTVTVAPTVGQTLKWNGTNWVPGTVAPLYEEITTDGVASSFTTAVPVAPKGTRAYVQVFLNGVLQMEGLGLTVVAPNTLNFATIPGVGNHIAVFSLL